MAGENALAEGEVLEHEAPPVVEGQVEGQPAVEGTPAAVEGAPAAQEPPKAPQNAPKWAMERINEETNRRQAEATAREAAERKTRDLEAMLTQLRNNGSTPQPTPQPAPAPSREEFQAQVRAEAAKQRFYEDTARVAAAGKAAFPDFADSIATLSKIGVANDETIGDILAVDPTNAHILFDRLAKNQDVAVDLARMDSRSRVAALTRMSMEINQPKPNGEAPRAVPAARISNAPAPRPNVDPTAPPGDSEWMSDKKSDQEWREGFKKKYGF